jgi:hypothetical protein
MAAGGKCGGRAPEQERQWRTLDWLPGYEISEDGDVWNGGRLLTGCICPLGYRVFKLTTHAGKKLYKGHRLVCEAFNGPQPDPDRKEVAHNDGNPSNNHYTNLRWASRWENNADRYLHGTDVGGEGNPRNVLTWEQVCEIRARYTGMRGEQAALAREYGVSNGCIAGILSGKNWPVTNRNGQPTKKAKVSKAGRYKKGRAYEYELRDKFTEYGLPCRRVIQSGGGIEKDDLVVTTSWGEEYRIEAKRRAKLPGYLINPSCHATIFRPDRGESLVLISFARFLELLQ